MSTNYLLFMNELNKIIKEGRLHRFKDCLHSFDDKLYFSFNKTFGCWGQYTQLKPFERQELTRMYRLYETSELEDKKMMNDATTMQLTQWQEQKQNHRK